MIKALLLKEVKENKNRFHTIDSEKNIQVALQTYAEAYWKVNK